MDVPLTLPDVYLFTFALFDTAIVTLLQLYIRMRLTELEGRNITAEEFCRTANIVVPLKVGLHSFLALLLLRNEHLFLFSLNFPVLVVQLDALCTTNYFNIYDIMAPGQIAIQKMFSKKYIMYYMGCFVFYLAWMIKEANIPWNELHLKPRPPFGLIGG